MFRIRDPDTNDEDEEQTKSKYFTAGSILNKDKSDSKESSDSNTATTSTAITVPNTRAESLAKSSEQIINKSPEKTSNPSLNRRPVSFGNTLLVNPNQTGNKLLKHLRVPYQMSDSISPAHYLMFDSCCAIFLSLKYHVIYQNYIYDKLNELRNSYQLKVLLLLIDHIEFQSALKELTQLAIRTNCTLMLCWSYEEAANYIENYKVFADKPPDIIMGKSSASADSSQDAYQCLIEALTSVKSINKTDAVSLISTFDTLENIIKSDDDQLVICPGMATLKAQRLRELFYKPFIRSD